MIIEINPSNPQPRLIRQVSDCLKDGGIIAYPTDTCYGIGCDIMNKKAIDNIYKLKQRDKKEPFSFICSDLKNISSYAKVSNFAYRTIKRHLPGPYTFILEGSRLVPKIMLTKRKTAGIRIPDNNICIAIVTSLGNPVISTSATTENGTLINDPFLIHEHYSSQIDIVIDGGMVPNQPSSVISLIDDDPEIIRAGAGDTSFFD
jgi:tRNA threonylcarbamoyl adenosine modification protein (Sua5/YciO/YrdC/YwlC family)